ncbi:MAG: peptidoglycan-associated lipoprotein Pal, partial [Candidatus Methylomirabilia bacterium]
FFRQPVEKSPLPPYVAATHFRHSATVVLVDGSSVEGDYVNLGTTVLRGMTPEGRVDIPWREIENVRFERTMVPKATQAKKGSPATVGGEVSLADVFFDFDMAVLRDDAKAALDRNIEWLRANPDVKLVVEGHADERGTKQYNLGLGGRRANAVRDYLAAAGVDGSRVSTISYGKERPFAAGHDESAWKVNRRAHFKTRSGAEAGPLPGAVLWVVRPERKER